MFPNTPCPDCDPCPEQVVPLPLPDLSEILCNTTYDSTCVVYTGPDIECLGITTNMTFDEIFQIFCTAANSCCSYQAPQNCVTSAWSDWGICYCPNDEEPSQCQQVRTRTVIIPAANGGTPCGPLTETRSCTTPNKICFTFGSYACSSPGITSTQLYVSPFGVLNDKPFYELSVCNDIYYVWFNNTDSLWHCNTTGFAATSVDQILDNNGNEYPISNDSDEIWINNTSNDNLMLISSYDVDACIDPKICFNIVLEPETATHPYTFFSNVPPSYTPADQASYPAYEFTVDVDGEEHIIKIVYNELNSVWDAYDNNTLIGTLDSTDFYPIGTWDSESSNLENYIVSSSVGVCVQPPDVDCVLSCGNWSACVGGTRTRTCIVEKPSSGNGEPCDELIQTEVCEDPFCLPITNLNVQIVNNTVQVSFTENPDASEYHIVYTSDNWATHVEDTFTSSPYAINYKCGEFFEGYVTVLCINGTESSQVDFQIAAPECTPRSLIGGFNIEIPAGNTIALDQSFSTTLQLPNLNVSSGSVLKMINIPNGYVCAGEFSQVFIGNSSPVTVNSIVLLNIDFTINSTFFGSGFQQNTSPGIIYELYYDSNTNRIYVGGTFNKYKGSACTPNFVVLNASTGNIDNTFAANTFGAENQNGTPAVKAITVDLNGDVWVGGQFTKMNNDAKLKYLCRFDTNGVVDNDLYTGNSFLYIADPASTSVNTILTDNLNNAYIGGTFKYYDTIPSVQYNLIKLLNNGSLDTSFSTGVINYSGSCTPSVNKLIFHNSRILVGGNFITYNGAQVPGFLRIDTGGNLDSTFTILTHTGQSCSEVFEIVDKNNKIYIGTTYLTYGTSTKKLYYVLNSNGDLDPSVNNTVTIQSTSSYYGIKSILIVP
jgi:hypothetical protein